MISFRGTLNNMVQPGFIRSVLLLVVAVAIIFPTYEIFSVYPRFTKFLVASVEDEAKRTAAHFSSMINFEEQEIKAGALSPSAEAVVAEMVKDFNLVKVKVFTPSGEIIYSTDAKDIGTVNTRDYFANVVARGLPYTKVVEQQNDSLEGQAYTSDVVETYVPIMRDGKFTGAFEIYYDITEQKKHLDELLFLSSLGLLALTLGLVAMMVAVLFKVSQSILKTRQAEEALRQSQKMQSLGNLAGGVAHEMNNLFFPILALSRMTLERLPDDSPHRERLKKIVIASERGKALVDQVMAFSRHEHPQRERLDIYTAVRESLGLICATLPSTVTLHDQLDEDVGTILGDASQIGAVLMNLISNAQDAMAGRIGKIDVVLSRVEIDAVAARQVAGLKSGVYAKLFIKDTGVGMDEKILERIFDPFFTTKEVGQGTGLGLSTVYSIVTQHEGAIRISSQLGVGTEVEVFFPLVRKDTAN
ncbi:MAG: ATP-binding protein [Rhodospirillales bacterium]|nr:ATP-binding protein [Rhodospirillales bacterium]